MKPTKAQLALRVVVLSLTIFVIIAPVAFAETPGEKLGRSITTNVNALIPAVLGIIAVFFLISRDWFKMISAFAIALVVAVFMNWTWVGNIATKLYNAFIA
ncbi:hypothetical protein SAMN02799624_05910 [Paenibacillus sp. UNC496MF]|uniref:hypothetical protein n=1 Tax=Paenibacillus sp. UNC496MF TaxID=1502753 RepID=UPI0008E65D2B|nr:hypothetical protein [Paenibacillus sp. UNC496MF]SFJ77236.1 hypothetical protein SAMN02799624_05910 [Paenibacillus sp. UNC496MF]